MILKIVSTYLCCKTGLKIINLGVSAGSVGDHLVNNSNYILMNLLKRLDEKMKNKIRLIQLLIILFLPSCSHEIMVNKRYVVKDEIGYLVFTQDEVIFYPFNDTIDVNFLGAKNHKEGYRVGFRTQWLDSMSVDYSAITKRSYPKKFSMVPVQVRYYLGEMWGKSSTKNSFSYLWNDQEKTLHYEIDDWRQILSISVLRQREKELLKKINFENSLNPHW